MPEESAHERLFSMIYGYAAVQAVSVAARLGLADLLQAGERSTGEMAAATGTHAETLGRLLATLANLGVLERRGPDRYALNELSELLVSGRPGSLRASAIFYGQVGSRVWGELEHAVRHGAPAAPRALGADLYPFLADHPDLGEIWDGLMVDTQRAWLIARGSLEAYDWERASCWVDVGGGRGVLLAEILRRHRGLRGVVFDQPHVVAGAGDVLAEAGVADRCATVGGDFLDAVPAGDGHLLVRVLFNWPDEGALRILRACRRAASPGGRLLVIEPLSQPWDQPARSQVGDLNNFLMFGGRTRTLAEHTDLLGRAGFEVAGTAELPRGYDLVEAVPAG
ncbi:MAG TPA: methyltransferase [Candidatus Dormibacteraeota bacterium]|nr:methyltransferase [Candidatus Dormibacteraeota bacterium]